MNHLNAIQEIVGGRIENETVVSGEVKYTITDTTEHLCVCAEYDERCAWSNWYKQPVKPGTFKRAVRLLSARMARHVRQMEELRDDYDDAVYMTRKIQELVPEARLISLDQGATLHARGAQIYAMRGQVRLEVNVKLSNLLEALNAISCLS